MLPPREMRLAAEDDSPSATSLTLCPNACDPTLDPIARVKLGHKGVEYVPVNISLNSQWSSKCRTNGVHLSSHGHTHGREVGPISRWQDDHNGKLVIIIGGGGGGWVLDFSRMPYSYREGAKDARVQYPSEQNETDEAHARHASLTQQARTRHTMQRGNLYGRRTVISGDTARSI